MNDMYDSNPEALFSYVVEQLNNFELAYLHVTEMGKELPGVAGPAFDLLKLRHTYRGIYMTNAGYDKARANAALAAGCDVALICNNREGAMQILRGLDIEPNPVLHARLARLHGRHPVTLESLHHDPAWRQAVSAMRELEENPTLSLEI